MNIKEEQRRSRTKSSQYDETIRSSLIHIILNNFIIHVNNRIGDFHAWQNFRSICSSIKKDLRTNAYNHIWKHPKTHTYAFHMKDMEYKKNYNLIKFFHPSLLACSWCSSTDDRTKGMRKQKLRVYKKALVLVRSACTYAYNGMMMERMEVNFLYSI